MLPLIQQYVKYLQEDSSDLQAFLLLQHSLLPDEVVELLCWDLEHSWSTDTPRDATDYRDAFPEYTGSESARVRLAVAEFRGRRASDRPESLVAFLIRYPELADPIRAALASGEPVQSLATDLTRSLNETMERGELFCNRYRLERLIGEGAFGEVFQAYDTHLKRRLAIKIPSQRRAENPHYIDRFLEEARTVARLEHPNIVTVYDSGLTPDGRVYVASRLIDGRTLDAKMMEGRVPPRDAARWVSVIASALQHAHYLRWIHRDVKPSNILIETATGAPFLADFGLAIREEDFDEHHSGAGTPNYMSPEQVRGEGHRLDGRSDQFSLAIVFYELLCGRLPFRGKSLQDLYRQIVSVDPPQPVEVNPEVPMELQRICLKALSKRISDRYVRISDMADELDAWLRDRPSSSISTQASLVTPKGLRSFDRSDSTFFLDLLPGTRNREGLPECIAFWKEKLEEPDPDKTFPVGLLYGPSGCGKSSLVKAGLLPHLSPNVTAIYVEATPFDTEVRLRRSLEKRFPELPKEEGLPALLAHLRRTTRCKIVLLIDQFEQWLHAHDLNADNEWIDAMRHCDGGKLQALVLVRDDFAMAASRFMRALEVRIVEGENFAVVDLFDIDHAKMVLTKFGQAYGRLPRSPAILSETEEQFLDDAAQGLAKDGKIVSVQLSLFADMVKKKPWNRGTLAQVGGTDGIGVHFLDETFEGRDANPDHRRHAIAARAVLHALLPGSGTDIKGHMRAQSELLQASGYTTRPNDFLELIAILDGELRLITPTDPEGALSGDLVNRRSNRVDSKSDSSLAAEAGIPLAADSTYYQLTHDFLVPPLRTWLTRKQQETRRGRAELKLTDRTAAWSDHPENKQLPTLWEWVNIRCLTDSNHWTPLQRKMLSRANRFHWSRLAAAFGLLVLLTLVGAWRLQIEEGKRVGDEVNKLEGANPRGNQILETIRGFEDNPIAFRKELLSRIHASGPTNSAEEHVKNLVRKLGLVSCTPDAEGTAEPPAYESDLFQTLIGAEDAKLGNTAEYIRSLRDVLVAYRPTDLKRELEKVLQEDLVAVVSGPTSNEEQKFRAALGLAGLDEQTSMESSAKHAWTKNELALICRQWIHSSIGDETARDLLRPIADRFLSTLIQEFKNYSADGKRMAARAIMDFQSRNKELTPTPGGWLNLLSYATDKEFEVFMSIILRLDEARRIELKGTLEKHIAPTALRDTSIMTDVEWGRSQAIAAIALLRMGYPNSILPVFDRQENPESISQFVELYPRLQGATLLDLMHLLKEMAARRAAVVPGTEMGPEFLKNEASRCYALLLAVGSAASPLQNNSTQSNFKGDAVRSNLLLADPDSLADSDSFLQHVSNLYRNDPSSSVHSASGWLLRHLNRNVADAIDRTPRPYDPHYQWFRISSPAFSQSLTFIVFEVPESATLKRSKPAEASIARFAILDREITNEEFLQRTGNDRPSKEDSPKLNEDPAKRAASKLNWSDAVDFCCRLSRKRGISGADQAYRDHENNMERTMGDQSSRHPATWEENPHPKGFRLPTKDEHQLAALGGATTPYSYGRDSDLFHRYAWIRGNSRGHPEPPRQKFPNGRGLFDMQGNVWEWTNDWNKDNEKPEVVICGGSFNKTGADEIHSKLEDEDVYHMKDGTVGFRIALSMEGFSDPENPEPPKPLE